MDIVKMLQSIKIHMTETPDNVAGNAYFATDVYDEELDDDTILNLSSMGLKSVPEMLNNKSLRVLYLQNNELVTLPDDFFPSLPCLMWLDLRDNQLTDLPKTIMGHPSLTHLLLQNNRLTSLPDELGTLSLKVLQLNQNPLMYPPLDIIKAGIQKTLKFLHDKYIDNIFVRSNSEVSVGQKAGSDQELDSYNSVLNKDTKNALKIELIEKDESMAEEKFYEKAKGKCPKLDKSRKRVLPKYSQSSRYLKPLFAEGRETIEENLKLNFLKEQALKKKKELITSREKIIQERKNIESLRKWRQNYRSRQIYNCDKSYRLEPSSYPYDTNPEYLTLLSREDIEKDLPDKYRKSVMRRSRPSAARKNNIDVHLAMKIKKLFENLEALNINRERMSPRTEQKVLLNEIQKISEIKEKLSELSNANKTSL